MENKNSQATKNSNAGEQVTETQETKTFEVFGCKIESNSCKGFEYHVFLKEFNEHVVRPMRTELCMNAIKVHELLDKATSVKVEKADPKTIGKKRISGFLIIETTEYVVSVEIPQEVNK